MTKNKIREEDVRDEEIQLEVDENAFEGPFTCCDTKTEKTTKKRKYKGLEYTYEVWECPNCGEEYLDPEQASRLEKFWIIEMLLEDKEITIERSLNYDGKNYFFRFPKDLTQNWNKEGKVKIKVLEPDKFLVEIEQ